MPYTQGTFSGERARQIARSGTLARKCIQPMPWWPEKICEKVERIVWIVYLLGDTGEDWHEFTAYDHQGKVLGVYRMDGY